MGKHRTVFFDLETSDSCPLGQILNFAFIEVDDSFNPIDELCGTIRASRLQLPSPDAILANRINIERHQTTAQFDEREGLHRIHTFLRNRVPNRDDTLTLIGFNSARFDIPFLRTSFIRNGLNPYFAKGLHYRDLYLVAKKLYLTHPEFPSIANQNDPTLLSLSLERIAHTFELLEGKQDHESRSDTLLTIRVAHLFASRFKVDVRTYLPYEPSPHLSAGTVVITHDLNYARQETNRAVEVPMVLLDCNYRYALWVDLNRFAAEPSKRAVRWFNFAASSLFLSPHQSISTEVASQAAHARETLNGVTLNNFFTLSQCDIEADIYRLDTPARQALEQAIWERNDSALRTLNNSDARELMRRHKLANYIWGGPVDPKVEEMVAHYARYRYGGEALLSKGEEGIDRPPSYHKTLREYLVRLEALRSESADKTDRDLLASLQQFYLKSDIVRLVPELARADQVSG